MKARKRKGEKRNIFCGFVVDNRSYTSKCRFLFILTIDASTTDAPITPVNIHIMGTFEEVPPSPCWELPDSDDSDDGVLSDDDCSSPF